MPKMGAQYCSSCSARPADGMASVCCYCCKCAFLRHSHRICTGSEGIELPVSQMTLVTCPGTSARGPPDLHHPTKRQLSRSASGLGASMHLHVEFRIDWHCNTLQSCALIANGQSLVQIVTDLLDACSNASSAASAVPRDQRWGSCCDSMEYVPVLEVFRNAQALGAMQRVLGRGDCFGLLLGYGNGPSWATGQVSWPPVSCVLCAVIFVHRVCSLCLPDLNPWTCLHTCMHEVQLLVVSAGRPPWHLTMLLSPPGPTCVQCESCQRCCSAPEVALLCICQWSSAPWLQL